MEDDELSNRYLNRVTDQEKIEAGKLSVKFDMGKLSIFHDGKKLTGDQGIFISVLTDNSWHDSTQSIWEKEKIGDEEFEIKGKFRRLPLSFLLTVKVSSEEKIILDLELELQHEITLDNLSFVFNLDEK